MKYIGRDVEGYCDSYNYKAGHGILKAKIGHRQYAPGPVFITFDKIYEPNPKKLVDVGLGIYPSLQPGELVMFDCIIQKGRLFAINVTGDRGKVLRGNQVSVPYLNT